MKVLFIGGLFPDNRKREFIANSKGIIQFAANNFQWSFINGFDNYLNLFSIYTAPSLGNFPRYYKKVFIKSTKFSHDGINNDYCVGFLNLPVIGMLSKTLNLYRFIRKENDDSKPYLIVYSIHTPFLLAAVMYKRKYPDSKICLIVPDLPEYMSANTGKLYRFLKYIDLKLIDLLVKKVDSFVFITDQMIDRFKVNTRPWVRIEGMYMANNRQEIQFNQGVDKVILYSGTLDSRYGIINLLEAFNQITDQSYRLWICGDGNMKKKVEEYAKIDCRVIFYGQITYEEVAKLQLNATVLVNPRTSDGQYTKYSFPIKTMEYLASGKPVIMNMLPGIPEEYRQYLFVPEKEDVKSLKDKIVEICSNESNVYAEHCYISRQFILNNKSPKEQTKKVISMLFN
jgi:glycosyltransferase involved in cell wall biosynthesis